MRPESSGREDAVNVSPAPVPRSKEEHLTGDIITEAVTFHGDTFPVNCCTHCDSRRAEAISLRARIRLLDAALQPPVCQRTALHHAVALVAMLKSRGMA